MKILGIDPGIGRMGWGVIQYQISNIKYQIGGCVETKPNSELSGRLVAIYDEVGRLIDEYKPDVMAIEELYFGKNVKTAFTVGHARGVILLAAAEKNIPINSYTPLQVKIAVTGYGKAEKQQVGHMVKTILGLSSIPKPDDTADALAIALTHAFSSKNYEVKSKK